MSRNMHRPADPTSIATNPAFAADKHTVRKQRTRKGTNNDRVTRRGVAHVIGAPDTAWSDDANARGADIEHAATLVPSLARAIMDAPTRRWDATARRYITGPRVRRGSYGVNAYDLAALATDAYGLEPLIGGIDVAYEQIIHADRADAGADIMDAVMCSARRDGATGWAQGAATDRFMMPDTVHGRERDVTPWQLRMSVPRGSVRSGERLQTVDALYGPMVDQGDGRYVALVHRYDVTRSVNVTWKPYNAAPGRYERCTTAHPYAAAVRFICAPSTVPYRGGRGTDATIGLLADGAGAAPCDASVSDRVFIGHKLVKRVQVKRAARVKTARTDGAYLVPTPDAIAALPDVEPGKRIMVSTPRYVGSITRSATSGRYSIVLRRNIGQSPDVEHSPATITARSVRTHVAIRAALETAFA